MPPAIPATITFTSHPTSGFVEESAPTLVSESFPSTTFGNFIGPGWGLFGGPTDNDLLTGRFGGWWPADRVQLPNHAPAGFFAEQQHRIAVSWSRYLCERNMLAQGLMHRVQAFIGPVGVQWKRRADPSGNAPQQNSDHETDIGDDPLIKQVQFVWDEWRKQNDWGMGRQDRERESRIRLFRDSECNLRFGAGNTSTNFLPWVRNVEPEQIRAPSGRMPEVPGYSAHEINTQWGVFTLHWDAETILGRWLCDPENSGTGEFVPASEMVCMKDGVDRTIKRGLPAFFPAEQYLQDALGVIANALATSREQASVGWIQKYANATPDQIRTLIQAGQEIWSRNSAGPVPGKLLQQTGQQGAFFPIRSTGTTRIIHADSNREFEPGPVSQGVPSFVQMVQASLKAVGLLFGIQDYFGDGGSFASELVEGSEFARQIEDRQKQQEGFVAAVAMKVIELAEKSGRLPPGTSKLVEPVTTPKPVVIGDEEKKVRTDLALYEKGLADPTDIIKKRGGDPKKVLANWKKWQQETGQGGQPGGNPPPGAPGNLARASEITNPGPNATPPGSAGGDGSSPNADPLKNVFEEVQEAGKRREGEKWVDNGGRSWELRDGRPVRIAGMNSTPAQNQAATTPVTAVTPPPTPATPAKPAQPEPAQPKSSPVPSVKALAKNPGADKLALQAFAHVAPNDAAREAILDAEWNVWSPTRDDVTPDERRRQTIERLAAAWRDANDRGDKDGASYAAEVIQHFGAEFAGPKPGETTEFNARNYESNHSIASGPAKVIRQPVLLKYPNGDIHVAIKGLVVPVGVREDAGSLSTHKVITVHLSNGTTYTRSQRVRGEEHHTDDSARASENHEAELHDDDRTAITSGLDRLAEELPPEARSEGGLLEKAKDVALTVAAKVYLALVKATPAMMKIGAVMGEIFDVPSDMKKLAYNPTSAGGQSHGGLANNDFVKQSIGDPTGLGLGMSGHLAISVSAQVLSRAVVWVKRKFAGKAQEDAGDGVTEWAKLIAAVFASVGQEMGVEGLPDAEQVEKNLRELLASRK